MRPRGLTTRQGDLNVTDDRAPWGRVDETGTVYVRDGEDERAVGSYPDATPE